MQKQTYKSWQILALLIAIIIAYTIFSEWEQFKKGLLGLAP